MQILAFGHRSSVGKDTCAKLVQKILRMEMSYKGHIHIVGFADPLKEKCYTDFKEYGHEHPEVYEEDRSKRDVILRNINISVVQLWITIGNFYRAFYPDYWVDALFNKYKNYKGVLLIKDLRYLNEVEAIKKRHGTIIKVNNSKAKRIVSVADDALESFEQWDYTINNETDIKSLMDILRPIVKETNHGS